MSDDHNTSGTLGPISAKLINSLLEQGKVLFTLKEAMTLLQRGHTLTSKLMADLVKRNVLARIKSGVFVILQPGQESTQLSNWPVIARELASPNSYMISHYSAMRLHGMTTHSLHDVYITSSKRIRNRAINYIRYHFIFSKPEHFWGYDLLWVTKQEQVAVSTLSRTILDGFDRSELCGDIKEVVRGLWIQQKNIDWDELIEYSGKFRSKSAVKRLGFVLQFLEIGTAEHHYALIEIIKDAKDYILLDPFGGQKGQYTSPWRVQVNIEMDELKSGVWE